MNKKILSINTDGGARGNPGPGACAFSASLGGKEIANGSKYLGVTTNNRAEYYAVLLALTWLVHTQEFNNEGVLVNIYLDSELVVKQLNGEYKIKDNILKTIAVKIKVIERELQTPVYYQNIRREKNFRADLLVNQTIDSSKKSSQF